MINTQPTHTIPSVGLAKHPDEDRLLTKWYELIIDGHKLHFRSEKFVPKKVEDKLCDRHCNAYDARDLHDSCFYLLDPYLDKIIKEARTFIKNNPNTGERDFKFDSPKFTYQNN